MQNQVVENVFNAVFGKPSNPLSKLYPQIEKQFGAQSSEVDLFKRLCYGFQPFENDKTFKITYIQVQGDFRNELQALYDLRVIKVEGDKIFLESSVPFSISLDKVDYKTSHIFLFSSKFVTA